MEVKVQVMGSPNGRNANGLGAAKRKHSPEIDAASWWQELKRSNDFVEDPLDKGGNGGLPVPQVCGPAAQCYGAIASR